MTELVLTIDDLDAYVRERVDIILVSGHANSSRLLHLPDEDRWMEPACNTRTQRADGWIEKSVTVYPAHYFPFCAKCAEARFDVEVIDDES